MDSRSAVRGAIVTKFLEYRAQISSLEETLDRDIRLISTIRTRFREEVPRVLEMLEEASYKRIEEAIWRYRALDSVLTQLNRAIEESSL